MTPQTNQSRWDETDVPVVAADKLAAAMALWCGRTRAGIVLVDVDFQTADKIESEIIAMNEEPAVALSVLARMRCLAAALGSRRLRHLIQPAHADALARLIETTAKLRLNPRWGWSPVKLAWTQAEAAAPAGLREAA